MYDILIKNGTVVDGTGADAFSADIAVKNGVIAAIAPQITLPAAEVIDAVGLIVAPGFIDSHTHSDISAAAGSDSYNFLEQGTTTQVAGQCGNSPAPYYDGAFESAGLPPEMIEMAKVLCAKPSVFMAHAKRAGYGTNMAFFVGHGALRGHAAGFSDAKLTRAQVDDMRENLIDAMDSGYLGYSSGLVYAPSVYADTEELTELAKVMKPYGGTYVTHIRGEGDNLEAAVAEAISIAGDAGVPLFISHLKVGGRHNEGKSASVLKMIDDAAARGMAVHGDNYPFTAGSAQLCSQIPPKYLVGGVQKMLELIRGSETRARVYDSMFNHSDEFESAIYLAGFDGTLVSDAPHTPRYVGMTIADIAKERNAAPFDALCDLLLENGGEGQGIYFTICESDMRRFMAHPLVVCGSDWSDYEKRFDPGTADGGHPRGTGTMPRRLEMCRDLKLRTLEDNIRSMTSLAARAAGISGRGHLCRGFGADITIFDYEHVRCNADFKHPFRRNDGIRTVIVNGKVAVREGLAVGERAGIVITRG